MKIVSKIKKLVGAHGRSRTGTAIAGRRILSPSDILPTFGGNAGFLGCTGVEYTENTESKVQFGNTNKGTLYLVALFFLGNNAYAASLNTSAAIEIVSPSIYQYTTPQTLALGNLHQFTVIRQGGFMEVAYE